MSPSATVTATAFMLLVGLLAGCQGGWPPPGSPLFQDGYAAGCDSGYAYAGRDGSDLDYRRGPEYKTNKDYKRGWDQGYKFCFEEEERTPRMVPGGPAI